MEGLLFTYDIILLLATVLGLMRYRAMATSSRIIVWYIAITCFSEICSMIVAYVWHNNLFVYHITSPIRFVILCYYYNRSIENIGKYSVGYIVGAVGILISITNSLFFQRPATTMNTHFLAFEAFAIIGLAMYSFYDMLSSDTAVSMSRNPNFWYNSILLVFWSFIFFYWLVGYEILFSMHMKVPWLQFTMRIINIVTYSAFALVFLNYKKMEKA